MNAPTDALRLERLDTVLALAASRLPAERRPMFEGFAREYFRQLDDDDLVERAPEDLSGRGAVALAVRRDAHAGRAEGARAQPHAGRGRLGLAPLGDPDRQRRHAVPGRLDHDRDQPAGADAAPDRASDLRGRARRRRAAGLDRTARREAPEAARESWMHVEVDRLVDAQQRSELVAGIERVLGDVRAAVEDWKPMLARLQEAIAELDAAPASLPAAQVAESRAFLQWLADDHFTLLGYRRHDLVHGARRRRAAARPRQRPGRAARDRGRSSRRPASRHCRRRPAPWRATRLPVLVVTKANTRSTVHRPGYTDYVGVKRYDASGKVIGEHRFLGLFTSTAYSARVAETPLLRGKVEAIVERAGLPPGGHLAKALDHILETYPRDELFQISDDELYDTALGILALGERQRLRLFVRRDPFERFVSCLVYVPRDAYSTDLRVKFQRILMAAFAGTAADFDVLLGDTVLARIHFTVRTTPGQIPAFDRKELEAQPCRGGAALGRRAARRPGRRRRRGPRHSSCSSAGARPSRPTTASACRARGAVPDVRKIACAVGRRAARARALPAAGRRRRRARLQALPARRAGGAVRQPADARAHGRARARRAAYRASTAADAASVAARLRVAGAARPATSSPRRWRACSRTPSPGSSAATSRTTTSTAWCCAPALPPTRSWCCAPTPSTSSRSASRSRRRRSRRPWPRTRASRACWWACSSCASIRHKRDEQGATAQVNAIEQALEKVSQPVRGPRAAPAAGAGPGDAAHQLLAHRRRPLGRARARAAASSASSSTRPRCRGCPSRRPLYEIFVYSPRFEGIHLRGGKVARGGLRWSDRPEDFRTEVLGLVKAQMVKNTVIVPVGSKGGFVLKKAPPPSDRDAYMKEGVACYQDYLRGLLDLTDNLAGSHDRAAAAGGAHRRRRPVPRRRRRQGHRHLLRLRQRDQQGVRPLARRRLRLRRQRRLRPQGHGHHRARRLGERQAPLPRAWASTPRATPFTVVGIGDMSGDVFGNGMLLSRHIRLVAAFDHRHIFIDPQPRRRRVVRRARAPVQAAALVVGRLRREADLRRRRRLGALGEIDPDLAAGAAPRSASRPSG